MMPLHKRVFAYFVAHHLHASKRRIASLLPQMTQTPATIKSFLAQIIRQVPNGVEDTQNLLAMKPGQVFMRGNVLDSPEDLRAQLIEKGLLDSTAPEFGSMHELSHYLNERAM